MLNKLPKQIIISVQNSRKVTIFDTHCIKGLTRSDENREDQGSEVMCLVKWGTPGGNPIK